MLPDFRVRQRDYLLEISRALTRELDLDKLLDRILKISIEMLAGKAGFIALRTESGKWHMRVFHGLTATFTKYIENTLAEVPTDPGKPEEVELLVINRLLTELTHTASSGLLTGVGLPLVTQDTVMGVIFIFRGYQGLFSSNDRALLSSFANQAAIAVQNAQLYSQITHEKQRMDALLDSVADGILILGNDLKIVRGNPAFLHLVGLTQNDIIDHAHDTIIQWETPPQGLTLEQAAAGGWPLTPHAQLYVEGDLKRKNQRPLPVGITYAPMLSEEGTLNNVIVSVRDITHFRQADELKSTFMSIISHELKTPVALIKGYAGTLRREDATWDRSIIQDSLQVIEEEADRLTGLIENLLDASRLEAGGLSIKRSDVSLPDLSNTLSKRLATQTTRHTIVTDFPPNFPIILADENRIRQVVSNLISNAIKYSPKGEIRITGQIRADQIIICVSDQGQGITPADLPHVFDRFYRAPDMAKHTKGAGLGLYLSKAIVEAHGGHIWVDTESGKGARICFSLPRQIEYE